MDRRIGISGLVSGESSEFRSLRQVVLPIMVIDFDGNLKPIGTCFVVSCIGKHCLALTAKHNVEHIAKYDGARFRSAESTPIDFRIDNLPSRIVNCEMFVSYWQEDKPSVPCTIIKAWFGQSGPDIAALLLKIPDDYSETFKSRLHIDSKGPNVGDKVLAHGFVEMGISDRSIDEDGVTFRQTVAVPLKSIPCEVVHCYGYDDHVYLKWPCFVTDQRFDGGMSGGPIVYARNGELTACGIVAASIPFSPEGVGSLIYPFLNVPIEAPFAFLASALPRIKECIRVGMIVDASEGDKHVLHTGFWCDSEIVPLTIQPDDMTLELKELGIMPELENLEVISNDVVLISKECLSVGKLAKHSGDNAYFFIVSLEYCELVGQAVAKKVPITAEFIKFDHPYVWIKTSDYVFRFFVFVVDLPGTMKRMKILTDGRIETRPTVEERNPPA